MNSTRLIQRLIQTAAMLVVVLLASPAHAQLAPGSDGHLLDANNRVGSSGRNTATPRNLFNTSNLYISGNTTRGTAFRGFSPIRDPSRLFSNLPSSVLENFERDSTGLEVISGVGGLGVTNPYFNRTQTVTSAGAIGAGRNLIGSSVPANTLFAPRYNSLAPSSSALGIGPLSAGSAGYGFNINPSSSAAPIPGTSPLTQYPAYTRALDRLRLTGETDALQGRSLFATDESTTSPLLFHSAQPNIYRNPYADNARRGIDRLTRQRRSGTDALRRPNSEEMLSASSELISPTAIAPKLFRPSTGVPTRDPITGRTTPLPSKFLAVQDQIDDALGSFASGTRPVGTATVADQPSQLDAMAHHLRSDLRVYTPDSIAAANGLIEGVSARPDGLDEFAENPEFQRQYERAQTVIERAATESLSSFAGPSKTSSAETILRAEEKVQEGQYYQAARLYELASMMAPDHAMPRLGHAHALLAAGEYMTAYRNLIQAIDLYPAFGYLNFDLTEFIPDVNLIDIRRADLERRLKDKEDYRLRFLLGYIENYIGLKQFAKPNLRRAAGDAPSGSVVARFPDLLAKPGAALKEE
ncbi:MAG: tetratricopeptide repeat protein [Planctomycetes bacterium]|nr:tetratricopeptide repeat protein [Planctomycetota bacterium]